MIKKGVTGIGSCAFYKCAKMKSVRLPKGVTSIGQEAFYGCAVLEAVTVPEGVTSVGLYAFGECTSLRTVSLPNSVTLVGKAAFDDCSGLTDVNYDSTKADWDKIVIETDNDPLLNAALHTVEYIRGDMNADGKITTDDAIYLLRYVLMPSSYPLS